MSCSPLLLSGRVQIHFCISAVHRGGEQLAVRSGDADGGFVRGHHRLALCDQAVQFIVEHGILHHDQCWTASPGAHYLRSLI